SLNPTFYAPSNSYNATYTCTLNVNDNKGGYASDTVSVYVTGGGSYNRNPYVDAGSNKTVQSGSSTYFNATASDPDGDYLTYSWSCTGGSLSSYSSLNPTFYAPSNSYNATYTCTLNVNDNKGGYASDTVSVYVTGGSIVYGNSKVTTNNATSITVNSARMNGYLLEDGGENTSVRFNWGRLNYFSYNTPWIDYKRTGNYFYDDALNLEKGKAYHFRAEARNSRGTVYGNTLKFITKPDSPLNFNASLINSYIKLTWNIGQGSCNTAITKKIGSYPGTISDGTLVYYGSGTTYVDNNITLGNNYYYRAWSIACDDDLYSISDSLYSKDFVTTQKPVTPIIPVTPVIPVIKKCNIGVDVLARNLTETEVSWKDSIYAKPGEEIEVMATVSAVDCKAENVILTNMLPVKIDSVYDVKVEGQSFCGDATGSFILGTIELGKSKSVIFKMKISGENSFVYGTTDLTNISEANGKNIETVRDTLEIRVSKKNGEEAMAGLSGFISNNWKIFYLFLGLLLGLIIFLIVLWFLRENDKKKKLQEENMLLQKSKYFHIQQ
ncbi:MAG: PKD domain-containing protein, partial [Candidatus Pacebacteria bacterium]|nr:PKD domain-containing protein [Candidatus Paceibacterota bacterium]